MIRHRSLVIALVWLTAASAGILAQSAQEDASDTARLIKALDIRAGSKVGEIGAGGEASSRLPWRVRLARPGGCSATS